MCIIIIIITSLHAGYEYDSKKAQYGPEQPLKFSGNSITLDIPKVQDEWKIFPNKPAKVIIYTKGRYLIRGGSRTPKRGVLINKCALAREFFRDHAHFY